VRIFVAYEKEISDRVTRGLIDLYSENAAIRLAGVILLSKLRDKRAVEPLIQVLADKDPVVRIQAAYALGCIGDERASEALHRIAETDCQKMCVELGKLH